MKKKRVRKPPASPYHATQYARNSAHRVSKTKREKDQKWKAGIEMKGSLGDRIIIENGRVILQKEDVAS